jgi:3D (Asp-Asp-Asp) domain-containing protein
MKAGKGVVAVDPRVIPLGTRLYIEGYGVAVAGDVGSAIKGRRIDLGFGTYAEAIRWGRRNVRVQILD